MCGMRARLALLPALVAVFVTGSGPATSAPAREVTVGYGSAAGLSALLARHDAVVTRRLPALRALEVVTPDAAGLRREPNVRFVQAAPFRVSTAEPALELAPAGIPYEWQYAATGADRVPDWVRQAAAAVTIAVVDTGADLRAPDLAAKVPATHDVVNGKASVRDDVGHGTFVASLAAGSVSNGEGLSGFGGDARLMVVKANRGPRRFDVVDEAAGIVWAVEHGARIVNLSLGGPLTARVEREAVEYAVSKGVLLVAAAGNEHRYGDPLEYPAALLQPPGSDGAAGRGLSVGASTRSGGRAPFSTAGSTVTLAAPGVHVLGAVSRGSVLGFARAVLPGSLAGSYGYGSGTSYAAPQVAGAAALVWAANPTLTAAEVADVLRRSASGGGTWNRDTGYGVLNVANAVALAGALV